MHFYTKEKIKKLDQYAVKNGLEIRQMMEISGFQMVALFKTLKIPWFAKIAIVCGKGNNGGDGLSAARFLVNEGWEVSIILADSKLNADAKHHFALLKKMHVPAFYFERKPKEAMRLIKESGIIIDALFGYNIHDNPREPYSHIIELVNKSDATVIAYDLPSGLDATQGKSFEPCIQADYTLALAIPKISHTTKNGKKKSGEIYVADIGIPKFLYDKISKNSRPDFNGSLIKL
ncbi:NAD(P)H-hydrate epimerase [Candidatus Peregrinibacteria bacterium]|nr:NAD(P)H-hydrate epimerase [Candidatus Peregrinibacteria bacterium]